MASEARLNLVITAQDQARSVIEDFAASIKETFAGLQEEMSKAFNMSSVESTVGEAMSAIQRDVSEVNIGNVLQEQFRTLNESVQETTRAVTEGFTQMAESATRTAEEMSNSMGDMGHSVSNMEQMMAAQMIGEQLTSIGEKGKGAFEEAISSAADFEFNMSRVGAVLTTVGKASNDQMSQMAEMALSLGSHSSFSANQIAEGMYTLARQGLDATTIMGNGVNGAINIVNDLAQATDSSLTDTATVITDIVHEYGLSGSELRNVANIMSGTLHNSSESLQDLYMSMRQVGPVASNMHQSVEDVSTALALLAQHGITGSQAGTSIKNMLLGLEPHTKKAAALMKDLGISAKEGAADSFYQLNGNLKPMPEILDILNQKFGGMNDKQKEAALAATFTKYGLAGLNVVVGESRDKFLAFQKELKMDDAATIAAKKYDNLHGDFIKLGAATQTMAKAFGDTLAPALRGVVQGVTHIVAWITQLPKPVKEAGLVALGLASALAIIAGTIVTVGISLAMMQPGLAFLATSLGLAEFSIGGVVVALSEILIPIALVVGAIAGLAYAFTHNLGGIKDKTMEVVNFVKHTFEGLKDIWKGGAGEGKGISILDNLGFSSTAISLVQNTFNAIKSGISGVEKAFGNVKNFIKGVFDLFNGHRSNGVVLLTMLGISPQTILQIIKIGDEIRNTFNDIKNTISHTFNQLKSIVENALKNILSYWNQHQSQIHKTASQVWDGISRIVKTAIDIITKIIGYFTDNVLPILAKVFKSVSDTAVKAFGGLVSDIGKGLSTVENWWNQYWPEIQQSFENVWNAIKWFLAPVIAGMTTIIIAGIGFIKGAWQNGWKAVVDILKAVWDVIKGVIEVAWHVISGIVSVALDLLSGHFSKAGKDFLNIFKNVFKDIVSTFGNLAKDAFDFGVNFVKMLAGGITSAIGAVTSAVSSVADKIKGFLGFHSPTREGPASESDVWGPNFVKMMATSIKEHTPKIQAAVNGIALSMKTGVTAVNHNISQQNISIPSNRTNANNAPIININIDGRSAKTDNDLAEVIAHKIYRQMPVVS